MSKFVEIRSYNLKPGSYAEFERILSQEGIPMLKRWGVDVVSFGPSRHEDDSYHLIRSYTSLAERQTSQDEFYGSQEWQAGPREAVLALIDNLATRH